MKYFIDDNIWYQGKRQPPRKVELPIVIPDPNGRTALCYDKDWDYYTLNLSDIKEDKIMEDMNIQLTLTSEEIQQLAEVTGYKIEDKEDLAQAVRMAIEKYVETYKGVL